MSLEVLAVQKSSPLAARALSMPALLRLVGKAWPPQEKRKEVPSLASLADADSPPRGADGRLLSEMAVWEVVKYFILPATADAYCSFITAHKSGKLPPEHETLLAPHDVELEYFASADIGAYKEFLGDESLEYDYQTSFQVQLPSIAKNTWFVSHAWSRPWFDLVDTIWQHYLRQPLCVLAPGHWSGLRQVRALPVFYWLDIWAVSQHFKGDFTKHPDSDFPSVITSGRGIVFTMSPWTMPTTVTRVWCLFEAMQALKDGKALEVFPERSFWEGDYTISEAAIHVLLDEYVEKLDASTAQATIEADRRWIMDSIKAEFGIDAFNAKLRAPLREKILEVLFVRSLKAGDVAALTMLDGLGVTLSMEELDLMFNYLGPDCIKALGPVLARSPAVKNLKLSGNNILDEGATAIAEAIQGGSRATFLDLGNNGITDEGAKVLAAVLHNSQYVAGLTLDRNPVGDEGGRALCEALRQNLHMGLYFHNGSNFSMAMKRDLNRMWIETRHPKILSNGHPDGLGGLGLDDE